MSIQAKEYTSKKTGKTSKKYYAVVFDQNLGKSVWSKSFTSQKDALREEVRLLKLIEEEKLVTQKALFSDVTEKWLETSLLQETYAHTTYKGYVYYNKQYIAPIFGDQLIGNITKEHIIKFMNHMTKKYSNEVINKCVNIISNIFKYGMDIKVVETNPAERIKRLTVQQKNCNTWTHEQILDFLAYEKVVNSEYRELIMTSFFVGSRPSEVCGIYVDDLLEDGNLNLDRGYVDYGVESSMKNKRSHRAIQLSPELLASINLRLETQKLNSEKLGEKYAKNNYLFKQKNGKPINPKVYSKNFKKLLKSYNEERGNGLPLPDICLYDARHSFATNLIAKEKWTADQVAPLMGNSARVCSERYVKIPTSVQADIISGYTKNILNARLV